MSAAEDDTELRDLLLQNLENSGVLNKLKAQMRAAVFLAMEEQDRIENKTPLVNENLKKCLNTKDGRVVAGLVLDFLRVFDLDFSLAVFEPEINSKQLESREALCKDLGFDLNSKNPVLLELVQRRRQDQTKDQTTNRTADRITDQTADQEPSQKQLESVRHRFDVYDKDGSGCVNKDDVKSVFFDLFPKMNRNVLEKFVLEELRATDRLFSRTCDWPCVQLLYQRLWAQCRSVVHETEDASPAEDTPVSKASGAGVKADLGLNPDLDLDQGDDGDSFFDDPLPLPQKTYGCSEPGVGLRRDKSLSDLSLVREEDSEPRKPESPVPSLSLGRSSSSEPSRSGASKPKGKVTKDKSGSHHHQEEDVEYDDDFNSHRSDLSHSEVSIGEEIEEVSIEGPSDKFDETTQDLSVSQISHTADYMEEVP